MPSNLKRIVRARMEKTGESYQQALRRVRAHVRPNADVGSPRAAETTASSEPAGGTAGAGFVHLATGISNPDGSHAAQRSLCAARKLHVIDAKGIASKLAMRRIEVVDLGRVALARIAPTRVGGAR